MVLEDKEIMKHILSNAWHEIIRFDAGEEAMKKLTEFVKEKNIKAGWVFMLGSARAADVAFYDLPISAGMCRQSKRQQRWKSSSTKSKANSHGRTMRKLGYIFSLSYLIS